MKMATAWWGCQILAETDDDKELLEKLAASLPNGADNAYEEGTLKIIDHENCDEDEWSYSADEIKEAKLVIEIMR